MSLSMDHILQARLDERRARHLYRNRRVIQSPQGAEVEVSGRRFLNFCSNDYLGLANHPLMVAAMNNAASSYGVGSGASHLINGHSEVHHQLELALAELTGRPRALLFSTGYMANLGIITALVGRGDAVFEDKLNHASLLDGGLLSGARFQRFLHNDMVSLEKRLSSSEAANKLIVVDGVFSMDGDLAPLPQLAKLAEDQNAWLMVDDAHGFGCLGTSGAGIVQHFGLSLEQVPVLMGTLGKALGGYGAFVAGSEALIESLIQFARPYIYTTAMPPAVAAANLAGLALLRDEAWRREHLQVLIQHFRTGAKALDLQLMDSSTAIQPILAGTAEQVMAIASQLEDKGFLVGAIRPPTVPEGSSRLRITLSAAHSVDQVDSLLQTLSEMPTLRSGAPDA